MPLVKEGAGPLFILLVVSSDAPSTLETASGLASAAAVRGHEVTVFFHMDGVRLLKDSQASRGLGALIDEGVSLLACRTSAGERGIDSEDELMEGAKLSSLAALVELLGRCDRALFLG